MLYNCYYNFYISNNTDEELNGKHRCDAIFFMKVKNLDSTPINIILRSEFKTWLSTQSEFMQNWIKSSAFEPKVNHHLCIPNSQGKFR